MKFLGIDYGTKYVGFAVSDQNGRLAFPKEVVKNNSLLVEKISKLIAQERISEIVIGESLDNDSLPNLIQKEIEYFISRLEKKFKLPVHKEKEFFSSVEAHGRMGKETQNSRHKTKSKPMGLDALAASVILQRYLDRRNNSDKGQDII